jgi:hypothetical protein
MPICSVIAPQRSAWQATGIRLQASGLLAEACCLRSSGVVCSEGIEGKDDVLIVAEVISTNGLRG